MTAHSWRNAAILIVTSLLVYFADLGQAHAVPSYARKYQTSCLTCHTIFPALNPTGEAFRRNGYRMPSVEGSKDTDAIKGEMIPMGQEAYEKMFPDAVWPDKIMDAVPLSVMANGGVALNIPGSDAHDQNGNTFTFDGLAEELHIFGAGNFSDTVTYFTQLTFNGEGVGIETAYLLWNDIVGPSHLVNLYIGRLMSPSLTSFGMHSSYMGDSGMPAVSVAGLYNPNMSFILGPRDHADGIELNGIAKHRIGYAVGWNVSSTAGGVKMPNAEDVYAHLGVKIGGLSLDGEGGSMTQDAMKPWAENSITIDAFAYAGQTLFDNGSGLGMTNVLPVLQNDRFQALGGQMRVHLASAQLTVGGDVEHHQKPFNGTPGIAADPTTTPATLETSGTKDGTPTTSFVGWGELDYVVFPWFVPGLRAEFTHLGLTGCADPTKGCAPSYNPDSGSSASLLRVMPGIAMLARPNIKVVVTGDLEWAHGLAPAGDWSAAGGVANTKTGSPGIGNSTSFMAEQVNAAVAWAF